MMVSLSVLYTSTMDVHFCSHVVVWLSGQWISWILLQTGFQLMTTATWNDNLQWRILAEGSMANAKSPAGSRCSASGQGVEAPWSQNTFSFWTFNGNSKFAHLSEIWKRRIPQVFVLSKYTLEPKGPGPQKLIPFCKLTRKFWRFSKQNCANFSVPTEAWQVAHTP